MYVYCAVYYCLANPRVSFIELAIIELFYVITIMQRFIYKYHTAKQLLVGTAIGALMGYVAFYMTTRYIEDGMVFVKNIMVL